MDPEEGGGGGDGSNAVASPARSGTSTARAGASRSERSGSASPTPVILRISPAEVGGRSGYIHLALEELADANAIRAYFDSVGREVTSIPCPDFEGFLLANSLRPRNVSFLSDLPDYILRLGRQFLAANTSSAHESSDDGRPDLSWLPRAPSPPPSGSSSTPASSGAPGSAPLPQRVTPSRPPNVTTRARFQSSVRPDPDGVDPPLFFSMGGTNRSSVLSPLSSSSVFQSIRGAPKHRGYVLTQPSSSSSTRLSSTADSSWAGSSSASSASPPSHGVTPPITATALTVIKDKPSDMGIKPITDKESWTDAKKIIDARLRRAPYWPGESRTLVTTAANAAASVWWEEVIAFYCKPPVSDLFVEESRFDGKGFEMIAHIDHHFNPSGAVDSLGYIFDLIDIKQLDKESVITLKARFSKVFSALKMGGIGIDSALQVGFMLRALLTRYQAVVQEFRLGRHSLTEASLQTVVDQCTNYDKDPWQGPVDKTGKVTRTTPSANTVGSDNENPYEALSAKSFNYHFGRWKKALREQKGKCMICFDTARNEHNTCDCPIMKNLGFKIEKRVPSADNPRDAASRAATETPPSQSPLPAPSTAPTPTPPPTDSRPGSAVVPGAFSAATEYDSGDEFDYEGKSDGAMYGDKSKQTTFAYSPASCSHTTLVLVPPGLPSTTLGGSIPTNMGGGSVPAPLSASRSAVDPRGVNTVYLPKTVLSLLANPTSGSLVKAHHGPSSTRTSLLVADTGATDHMLPDKSAFISYHLVSGRRVRMGNNSFAPIAGHGTAIISLNGRKILIRDCLHVPDLRNPLYSLRAHQRQRGCGFIGMFGLGMHVFFPTFILEVDTATDCHLQYEPIGRDTLLSSLDYIQPKSVLTKSAPPHAATTQLVHAPVPIEPDDDLDCPPTFASHYPKRPPSPQHPPLDMSLLPPSSFTQSLKDLDRDELIRRLYTMASHHDQIPPTPPNGTSTAPLECMSHEDIISTLHHQGTSPPAIRPCDTPNASDTKYHFTAEELHRLTGCRRFRNYRHLIHTSKDGHFLDNGEFPVSLGAYTTIPKAPRGKLIDRLPSKYLDVVHIDIAFGDCMSVGGFKYALIFVDRATRFNWCFGLKSLHHDDIISAFLAFRAEAGNLARQFRCDCDEKLFGSHIRSFLHLERSSIVASPAGRQSANGLVESHWKIMVHMSRAYLTEKQMPRTFWYYAVKHAARMMNMVPGRYNKKLASPFMLVHGVRPDPRTWLPIFSLCYFHHEKDSDASRSKNQAHTLDGIILGRSPTSNAILVYNPRNQRYYEPDSYKIDAYRLPSSVYPTIIYDGGLFVSLHRGDVPAISEPYPPGTRVEEPSSSNDSISRSGTVVDIPMDPNLTPQYLVQFDDGTTKSFPASKMASLIPPPRPSSSDSSHLLPPFLRLNSKITFEHEGQYHKGFLSKTPDGPYCFIYKSHINKKHPDWSVPLPNLTTNWQDLCMDGILIPGHSSGSFLRDPSSASRDPSSASLVSAASLLRECPRSLLSALAPTHPDRDTWLASFREEKDGIKSQDTYDVLTLEQYRAYRAKGAPRAIPTMCVLTIKPDEMLRPHRAKSRIVVLGNHEDRIWTKSEKYAPVLRPDTLRLIVSMAIQKRRTLKQGDCKNAFCQGILPPDEITIVKPPIGDPDAKNDEFWLLKRTLYGLRRSPKHWYDKIRKILTSLGLQQNAYDPCLFSGHVIDPSDPTGSPTSSPLTLGLYVDDFVYFSDDPAVEATFERLLKQYSTVDFMGTVEWFLGTHFQWLVSPDVVKVHLSQTGFASHLVEETDVHLRNITPDATPYRSGLPIDACPESDEDELTPTFMDRKRKYQSIVGSIGWLAQSTRPDLAPSHSFLSAYCNKPSRSHLNAALYVLHYIHSTIDYGFSFSSEETAPLHTYMSFPHSSDTEAYTDALPPSPDSHHRLTTYSDACWGSQIGNAIREGIQLPLFKFRSMSGAIIFRSGGPITWKTERQERTSLSSCDAEIRATAMGSRLTVNLRNMILHLQSLGYPIDDTDLATTIYNDNEACVKWCHNLTTKGNRHIEHRENATREWVADGSLAVSHVSGKCNPSDIFTKEMRDGANFRRLRDSFMSRASDFLKNIFVSLGSSSKLPAYAAQTARYVSPTRPSILDVLLSHPLSRTRDTISCLSSAGRYVLSRATGGLSCRIL